MKRGPVREESKRLRSRGRSRRHVEKGKNSICLKSHRYQSLGGGFLYAKRTRRDSKGTILAELARVEPLEFVITTVSKCKLRQIYSVPYHNLNRLNKSCATARGLSDSSVHSVTRRLVSAWGGLGTGLGSGLGGGKLGQLEAELGLDAREGGP